MSATAGSDVAEPKTAKTAKTTTTVGSRRRGPDLAAILPWLRRVVLDPRVWIALLAFVLRLSWVLLVPSRPVGDFALYRESAEFLADQGTLDPEFIYMPGYVFLLALVRAAGGGLLAAKMIGVVAGTALVVAVGGITEALFGRRPGLVAGVLMALWPAGIAVASVTGTDVPAAALMALSVFALVRLGPNRPWWAAGLCGGLLGLAAWVRAVAVPLAGLSLLYWLATGRSWSLSLRRAGLAAGIALVVLLPWGVRNHAVYGEFFLTDSHGGPTALVGANPNSDGTFSRSLNLMFQRATGLRVLESTPRHRASDRAAYQLAKSWTGFEPAYAVGLVAAKAERLLAHERNLLYWPLYRQGVLGPEAREFFDDNRAAIERLADRTWWLVCALAAAGVTLAARRHQRAALALLSFPLALCAIYSIFFSEVRYHLAIAPLLFPYAAVTIDWVAAAGPRRFHGESHALAFAAGGIALMFMGWWIFVDVGAGLRAGHRWAVALCAYPDAGKSASKSASNLASTTHVCRWQWVPPARGSGGDPSPVRGVWDGVGLRLPSHASDDVLAAAGTEIDIPAGRYRVSALASLTGTSVPAPGVAMALKANGRVIARVIPAERSKDARDDAGDAEFPIAGLTDHPGGPLGLEIDAESISPAGAAEGTTAWLSKLVVERPPD